MSNCRFCRFRRGHYCGHPASTGPARHPRYTWGFERRTLNGCGEKGRWFEEA